MQKYFLGGICGMGMAPLALLLKGSNSEVVGFDNCPNPEVEAMLRANGVNIVADYDETLSADEFIISTALISRDFKGRDFKQRGQAFAEFCDSRKLIAIVGSHGKTSVTNMCAYLINKLEIKDIGYMLGAMPNGDYLPAKNCKEGDYILAEIDESDATIENFSPEICCALNFDLDHTNTYANKDDVIAMFERLFARTKSLIIVPKNSKELCEIAKKAKTKSIEIVTDNADFDSFNKSMASALMSLSCNLDISIESLENFSGTKRRQEILFEDEKVIAIADYAHHPKEVEAFLAWLNKKNNDEKLIFFQPHRFSRTKEFYAEFREILLSESKVYILPVYAASEAFDANATSQLICEGTNLELLSFENLKSTIEMLRKSSKGKLCLAFVGAGDIYFKAKNILV